MNNSENKLLNQKARHFILQDQNKEDFNLSDFKDKKILLSFHPLAWTSICAEQMESFEVAKLYNIFREKDGFSERANIIIDENHKIVYFNIYEISKLPNIEEIISFLNNI